MKIIQKNFNRFYLPILLSVMILLLSLALTWFLDKTYEDNIFTLSTLGTVASLITSLLLFGIAVSLHKKFETNQSLLERQTDSVLRLLENIQGVRFSIEYSLEKEGPGYGHIYTLSPLEVNKNGNIKNELMGKVKIKQFAHPSLFSYFETLIKFAGNIYIPKELSDQILREFEPVSVFAIGVGEQPSKYNDFTISAMQGIYTNLDYYEKTLERDSEDKFNGESSRFSSTYNDRDIDIDNIIQSLKTIYSLSYKWLKKNNEQVLDGLNLYHKVGKE